MQRGSGDARAAALAARCSQLLLLFLRAIQFDQEITRMQSKISNRKRNRSRVQI